MAKKDQDIEILGKTYPIIFFEVAWDDAKKVAKITEKQDIADFGRKVVQIRTMVSNPDTMELYCSNRTDEEAVRENLIQAKIPFTQRTKAVENGWLPSWLKRLLGLVETYPIQE